MEEKTGNILVIEDEESWRELIQEVLEIDGHQVTVAKSYSEALHALENNRFDVATIDVRLEREKIHNVDGIRILKKAKEKNPDIKAIILTGYPNEEQKQRALEKFDADGYYEKVKNGEPIKIDELSKLVTNLLNLRDRKG